jgi:hypothetical protein
MKNMYLLKTFFLCYSGNLDDLLSTLKNQISNSDWLEKNTADKWVQENPDLAKEYIDATKKS